MANISLQEERKALFFNILSQINLEQALTSLTQSDLKITDLDIKAGDINRYFIEQVPSDHIKIEEFLRLFKEHNPKFTENPDDIMYGYKMLESFVENSQKITAVDQNAILGIINKIVS